MSLISKYPEWDSIHKSLYSAGDDHGIDGINVCFHPQQGRELFYSVFRVSNREAKTRVFPHDEITIEAQDDVTDAELAVVVDNLMKNLNKEMM